MHLKKTLLGIFAVIAFALGLLVYSIYQKAPMLPQQFFKQGIFVLETPRGLSDFQLNNHKGESFSKAALKGHWSLVFFGFTHCPDICPTTLAMLKQATQKLEAPLRDTTDIVLVTVDPARDTIDKMRQYVGFFGSGITGVTGEFMEIHSLTNSLSVPFQKIVLDDGSYTVDHSGYIYLINPEGQYQAFFKPPFEATAFANKYAAVRAYLSARND